MLSPREFYDRYGHVFARTYSVDDVNGVTIPENLDRYLLVFWYTESDLRILPKLEVIPTFNFGNFTSTSAPIVITHALWGAGVNHSWTMLCTLPGTTSRVVVLEGIMREITKSKRGKKSAA